MSTFTSPPAQRWLATIPLNSAGGLGEPTVAPLLNPGDASDPTPFDPGPCSVSTLGDTAGRGSLTVDRATGDLYETFSNVAGDGMIPEVHRIYVRRYGAAPFLTCVDEFTSVQVASQGHVDENDPRMAYDPVTGQMILAYSRGLAEGGAYRQIVVATSGDGHKWKRQTVCPTSVPGDRTQPALALTSFDDVPARQISGTFFLSWYEPSADPQRVTRVAQGFVPLADPKGGLFWDPVTRPFPLPLPAAYGGATPFITTDPADPMHGLVFEYQGAAHLPGVGENGSWVGVHTAPTTGTAHRVFGAVWP